jgi:polar amino acid transport system substrate-binding protein
MKRALLVSSLVTFALTLALSSAESAGELDAIKKRGELIVGVEAAFPPFESIQDGQMVGFDIDLARAFAESLGVKARFVDTSFPGLIPGLLEGKFDVLISAVIITAERAKRVDFSQPYAEATETLVIRADDRAIKGKEDLRGKVVAVQSGTTVEKLTRELDEQFKKSGQGLKRIAVFDHAPEMFLDLDSKRSDAIVTLLPNFIAISKKFPDRYRVVGDLAGKSYVGIVTRKDTRELSEFLDTKLGEMKKSGRLAELQTKWFGDRMNVPDKRVH